MPTASVALGGNAKTGQRERAYSTPQPVRLSERILKLAQDIWPGSTQKNLAKAAGVSPRSVEYWSSGRGLSADALASLIRSEEGFKVLDAIMQGSRPKWWRICESMMRVAEVRQMQELARRKMRRAVQGALDADDSISASIAAAEASLPFSDEEFRQPHLDAMRAVAGSSHRSVDTSKVKR